jgi:hypothetical protein
MLVLFFFFSLLPLLLFFFFLSSPSSSSLLLLPPRPPSSAFPPLISSSSVLPLLFPLPLLLLLLLLLLFRFPLLLFLSLLLFLISQGRLSLPIPSCMCGVCAYAGARSKSRGAAFLLALAPGAAFHAAFVCTCTAHILAARAVAHFASSETCCCAGLKVCSRRETSQKAADSVASPFSYRRLLVFPLTYLSAIFPRAPRWQSLTGTRCADCHGSSGRACATRRRQADTPYGFYTVSAHPQPTPLLLVYHPGRPPADHDEPTPPSARAQANWQRTDCAGRNEAGSLDCI